MRLHITTGNQRDFTLPPPEGGGQQNDDFKVPKEK